MPQQPYVVIVYLSDGMQRERGVVYLDLGERELTLRVPGRVGGEHVHFARELVVKFEVVP